MTTAMPRPADGDRPARTKVTPRIPHGSLWARGLLLAEVEIETAGPPSGRWARASFFDLRPASGRQAPEADILEEAGARSLAA